MTKRLVSVGACVAIIMLAACGGGGGGTEISMSPTSPVTDDGTMTGDETIPHRVLLPFPFREWQCQYSDPSFCGFDGIYREPVFGIWGVPDQTPADARHMPIYHDHDGNDRRFFVGIDHGTALIGELPVVGTRGETDIRHGRLNDGVGADTLAKYLLEVVDDPALRWKNAPVVRFGGNASEADFNRLVHAVQLVNAALPADRKMQIVSDTATSDPGTGIYFSFVNEQDFFGNAWGRTFNSNSAPTNQITHSSILINKAYTSNGDRQAIILLAHELIHALGMFGGSGHVSPEFDSIMEGTRTDYATAQGIKQPMSLLYPVDREALRALYSRLEDGMSPTDFGSWESTSLHVHGNSAHAGFGVALRNGYAEPWAYGYLPTQDLADNPDLSGTATWIGTLVGLSPNGATVAGDASVGVNLGTMAGLADFTNLETWRAGTAPGEVGSGTEWLDGDLGYTIAVRGNTFRETGGDDGRLTGIFVGREHEGATGTLERSDLTAAFGTAR